MSKIKVFITGVNGYIGRHVAKEAVKRGFEVSGVSSDNASLLGVKSIDVDIFSGDQDIYNQVGRPDILIHLAWRDGFVHNSSKHMSNLSNHVTFIENYVSGGGKNVSVMGSMHEVGYWEGGVDEFAPCNPLSQYGVAKNALRQSLMLSSKSQAYNLYWLRAFYIYGDDMRSSSVFSKIMEASNAGVKTFPFTTGKNKYDFISIEKLAEQIVAASTQKEITGIINVCSGKATSLAEQVEDFIKKQGLRIKLDYGAFPDRPYDSPSVFGDNGKIRRILRNRETIS